jgi:activator of HSP90 ATPase
MAFDFSLSAMIPATPQEIYAAWLDSRRHSAMIGGEAKLSAKEGAAFTAWDGYISGRTVALEPGWRIVQSWRTTKFAEADPDSQAEILLVPTKDGTRLTLHHTNVPDGHTGYRDGGWQDHYFAPMKKYFARRP